MYYDFGIILLKWLNVQHNNIWKKNNLTVFLPMYIHSTTLSIYFAYDFIVAIVAQVSEWAHGPFV